jgi:SAM-dependent methyltransferase
MRLEKRALLAMMRQFGRPRGLGGRLAGWVMAHRSSNVARSRWAVGLLDLAPGERLLEVGCGPGVAIAAAARTATVVGVDPSEVMVAQARRRNRRAVRAGRVVLHASPVEGLPRFETFFDKALAVNTVGHWDEPVAGLKRIREALRPGGVIAVVSQPRKPGATAADTRAAGEEIQALLDGAGYVVARAQTLDLSPPVICVLARRPNGPAPRRPPGPGPAPG